MGDNWNGKVVKFSLNYAEVLDCEYNYWQYLYIHPIPTIFNLSRVISCQMFQRYLMFPDIPLCPALPLTSNYLIFPVSQVSQVLHVSHIPQQSQVPPSNNYTPFPAIPSCPWMSPALLPQLSISSTTSCATNCPCPTSPAVPQLFPQLPLPSLIFQLSQNCPYPLVTGCATAAPYIPYSLINEQSFIIECINVEVNLQTGVVCICYGHIWRQGAVSTTWVATPPASNHP